MMGSAAGGQSWQQKSSPFDGQSIRCGAQRGFFAAGMVICSLILISGCASNRKLTLRRATEGRGQLRRIEGARVRAPSQPFGCCQSVAIDAEGVGIPSRAASAAA
jgi:hypothetical protein